MSALGRMVVGPSVMTQLLRYGTHATPFERCGILFGRRGVGVAHIEGIVYLPNVAEDREHTYEFDPDEQAEVWARVERMGFEVLVVWHTHPTGPAHPSQTDVEHMVPWLLYAVLVPQDSECSVTVWRLRSQVYEEASEMGSPIGHSRYESVPHEVQVAA